MTRVLCGHSRSWEVEWRLVHLSHMPPANCIYRFGPYELRTRTPELYKHGSRLKLRPQPFQVLKALVERAGDLVTREELRQRLWSGKTFVDFEHGLNTSITELRSLLNDSASEPRYIETLPKLGYRIIVRVDTELTPPVDHADILAKAKPPSPSTSGSTTPPALVRLSVGRAIAVALAAILLLGLAVYIPWSRSHLRSQSFSERVMLAVLPFANLTGDAGQEYFSDGLTEEMIAQLGRLEPQRLGVIARTSVMLYKHTQKPLPQIGRELGVQYVLEGSVRRDPDKVRISAQLIRLADQTHIWSRQYDRDVGSLLALQGEIAREVADEIKITLGQRRRVGDTASGAARTQPSVTPKSEAYDLYLKGLYFWNKRTVPDFQLAINYFQQAITRDPNYARAYAGLADCYALIGGYSFSPQAKFMSKARAVALRALQIDEFLPEAHAALALIVQNYNWDWQTAEEEYRRAIELDPNYATAHHWYAEHLMWRGRFDEALRENEGARQLDPLSLIIATDNGAILYNSRQYDRAIEQFRAVLDMDPNFPRAHVVLNPYVEMARFDEALAEVDKIRRVIGDETWSWCAQAYVYGRAGQRMKAQRALEKLEELNRRRPPDPAALVWAYLGVADKDQTFAWLEKAYSQHSNVLATLKVEPAFDPLRSDPRFQDLLHRVNLDR